MIRRLRVQTQSGTVSAMSSAEISLKNRRFNLIYYFLSSFQYYLLHRRNDLQKLIIFKKKKKEEENFISITCYISSAYILKHMIQLVIEGKKQITKYD